jgi:hypothetical protein
MIRPILAALGCCLLLSACDGKDAIQKELDRIKADGSPISIEDLGLPPGGYESPQWKTILDISEKLTKERKEGGFNEYQVTAMKSVGPGVAECITRSQTLTAYHDKKPITWAEWNKMLATTRELMGGLPKPEPRPEFIPDYSQGLATQVPHINAAMNISQATSRMILGEIHQGKIDQALKELSQARHWGKNLTGHSTLIEGLVLITCDSILLADSWEILQQQAVTEPQLIRLAGIWDKGLEPQEALLIWQGERVCGWQTISRFRTLKDLREASRISQDSPGRTEFPSLGSWVTDRVTLKFLFNHDLAFYLSFFHRQEVLIKGWIQHGNFLPLREESQRQEEFLESMPKWKRMRYLMSSLSLPGKAKILDKFAATIAQQRLLKTAIALKRHQSAHKAWPDSLDQLTPAYLPSIPLDPIDGQPLRYKKAANEADGYTLYSIGVNGIDDGGDGTEMKPRENGKPDYSPDKTRDILWPRAAP